MICIFYVGLLNRYDCRYSPASYGVLKLFTTQPLAEAAGAKCALATGPIVITGISWEGSPSLPIFLCACGDMAPSPFIFPRITIFCGTPRPYKILNPALTPSGM